MRRTYVYEVAGGWQYEIWFGPKLSVIGGTTTKERAEMLARLAG